MHTAATITEQELISQCKKGSLKYQEQLYKKFYSFATGIAVRYSLYKDDTMEVVNDAFIKVFNSIKNYDENKSFKAWLRTIVVNTAIDRRRKDLKFQLNVELDAAIPVGHSSGVVESLSARDILNLMQTLPVIQLTIFNLYEVDGYNHDEIGEMLSIPASSSRVYLSRAKEKLRKMITTEAHSHG